MSDAFRLPGIALFDAIQEEIDTIVAMRESGDHRILEALENILRNSVEEATFIADEISQTKVWFCDITDILLGKNDKKGNRNTEKYKKKVTGKIIEEKLTAYIIDINEKMKNRSSFLRDTANHFRITLNNWKEHLFTCYDYEFLPNTNLDLELSHSRMKRKHRKITGLKNSHQFILTHGEHFSFCFDTSYSYDLILSALQKVNHKDLKVKTEQEKEKSKKRGKDRITIKNLPERLEEAVRRWQII